MKIDSVVNWVERVASLPNKGLHWVAMVVLLLLMFLTVADVVARYLVGIVPGFGPVPGSFELTEFMLAVIVASQLHWVAGTPPSLPHACTAKVRYRQTDQACTIGEIASGTAQVTFAAPQRAVTRANPWSFTTARSVSASVLSTGA